MGLSIGSMVGIAKGVIGSIRSGKFSPSGMMRMAKLAMIDSEVGEPQRSEFYFTNVETEEELRLCMSPERVKGRRGKVANRLCLSDAGVVRSCRRGSCRRRPLHTPDILGGKRHMASVRPSPDPCRFRFQMGEAIAKLGRAVRSAAR